MFVIRSVSESVERTREHVELPRIPGVQLEEIMTSRKCNAIVWLRKYRPVTLRARFEGWRLIETAS